MRDSPVSQTWKDYAGREWPVVRSKRALKFSVPAHRALRAHIFHCDGFACVRCGAAGVNVPDDYDGSRVLFTNTLVSNGFRDMLILDHILTRKAGGANVVENLQTLCETCNKGKQREDRAATDRFRLGGCDA